MKNLKLAIAAVSLAFATQVSAMNINSMELKEVHCNPEELASDKDIAMWEAYDLINEESDAEFDFNLKDYLPESFNAYAERKLILSAHEMLNAEADAAFDFDPVNYLPADFNPYSDDSYNLLQHELLNEEADEPFDFDTENYLPVRIVDTI